MEGVTSPICDYADRFCFLLIRNRRYDVVKRVLYDEYPTFAYNKLGVAGYILDAYIQLNQPVGSLDYIAVTKSKFRLWHDTTLEDTYKHIDRIEALRGRSVAIMPSLAAFKKRLRAETDKMAFPFGDQYYLTDDVLTYGNIFYK